MLEGLMGFLHRLWNLAPKTMDLLYSGSVLKLFSSH